MTKEKLTKWEPIRELPSPLYLCKFVDNSKGIEFIFQNHEHKFALSMKFKESVFSYRYTADQSYLKLLKETVDSAQWQFFVVHNSKYIEWFIEQSLNTQENKYVLHYLIATPDCIIDILACTDEKDPVFTQIEYVPE